MAIQRLPEFLINQIKAGEVIERPAALVKELLENSIDAQAQHITLHLARAGLDLIHIADDGQGMSAADLALAFERHATSKIRNFEDLYHLQSFGFRGEALASAAAVARIVGQSAPQDDPAHGHKIVLQDGKQISLTPIATRTAGTQLWISDLFYNTPARLKFVRSLASEKMALRKVLHAFLLAYPQIEFTVQWDEEDKKIYRATALTTERWLQLFPAHQDFLAWQASYEDYALKGIVALTATSHKHPYWFCNQRYFQDKTLHQIVAQTMQNFWQGRSGLYAIFIAAPPEEIDVNVHPNKLTIKFAHPAPLYALLSSSLKKHLATHQTFPADTPLLPDGPAPMSPERDDVSREGLGDISLAAFSAQGPSLENAALAKDNQALLNLTDATTEGLSLDWPILRPPELPGYICYVYQGHTYLLAISALLAATWQAQQNNRTPLLVVRTWDCPPHFSALMADELTPWGLAAEVVQDTIFLREVPTWIMRYDLWPLLAALWAFWPQHSELSPPSRWAFFWQTCSVAALNLSDPLLAHLVQELPPALHAQYGQSDIFAATIRPRTDLAPQDSSPSSTSRDLHA